MKIAVVGGGNIGTLLYAELKRININAEVILITRSIEKWSNELIVTNQEKKELYRLKDINVTNEIISDADYYFFTLPKHLMKETVLKYVDKIKDSKFIFVPGTGGIEFLYTFAKNKKIDFIGLQRVPYIARLNQYGHSVSMLSKKENVVVSSMNKNDVSFLEKMLDINVDTLPNYLCVTLTPSNPILHTTRLYSMFSKKDIRHLYDKNILFYESWDNFSSENLLGADAELQTICKTIKGLDLRAVKSLKEHYESKTINSLTKKISSIKAFQGILSPMYKIDNLNKYIVDLTSRYFLEDFEYGLVIVKAFSDIINLRTPYIDKVLNWYSKITKKKILTNDNKLIHNEKFLIPQNYFINDVQDIIDFYK